MEKRTFRFPGFESPSLERTNTETLPTEDLPVVVAFLSMGFFPLILNWVAFAKKKKQRGRKRQKKSGQCLSAQGQGGNSIWTFFKVDPQLLTHQTLTGSVVHYCHLMAAEE